MRRWVETGARIDLKSSLWKMTMRKVLLVAESCEETDSAGSWKSAADDAKV